MAKILAVPLGIKGAAILASAAAHVAIGIASLVGGHGPVALAAATDPRGDEVDVEVAPEPEPQPAPPPAVPPPAAPAPAPPTHTHDYPVPPSHDAHPHDPRLVHAPVAPLDHDDDHDHDPPSAPQAAPVVTAPVVTAPVVTAPVVTAPARVTITVGTGGGGTNGAGAGASPAASSGAAAAPEIVAESAVAVPARVVASVRPLYPPSARASGVEADVALLIVVDASGAVASASVARPAGYGFDDAALHAIRAFRFSPAQQAGRAVAVRMRWVIQFRLE